MNKFITVFIIVAGPCKFLGMYNTHSILYLFIWVAGPCKFLGMYNSLMQLQLEKTVAGPCKFLGMYNLGMYNPSGLICYISIENKKRF